jgi:hypothetical protein
MGGGVRTAKGAAVSVGHGLRGRAPKGVRLQAAESPRAPLRAARDCPGPLHPSGIALCFRMTEAWEAFGARPGGVTSH